MAAKVVEDGADQPDGYTGIVQDQLGEQAAGLAGQLLPQPEVASPFRTAWRLI